MMIHSGTPLWFRWNKNQKEAFTSTIVDQYRPQIFDPQSPTGPGPLHPHSPSYNTLAPAMPKFPKPYQGSGQRMGGSWEEFFCRCNKRQLVMEAAESKQARRSHLDQEQSMKTGACPGTKAKVKVWQWIEDLWRLAFTFNQNVSGGSGPTFGRTM